MIRFALPLVLTTIAGCTVQGYEGSPPSTSLARVVFVRSDPGITFERSSFDGNEVPWYARAIDLKAGEQTARVRVRLSLGDPCDTRDYLCSQTVVTAECSGKITLVGGESYSLSVIKNATPLALGVQRVTEDSGYSATIPCEGRVQTESLR